MHKINKQGAYAINILCIWNRMRRVGIGIQIEISRDRVKKKEFRIRNMNTKLQWHVFNQFKNMYVIVKLFHILSMPRFHIHIRKHCETHKEREGEREREWVCMNKAWRQKGREARLTQMTKRKHITMSSEKQIDWSNIDLTSIYRMAINAVCECACMLAFFLFPFIFDFKRAHSLFSFILSPKWPIYIPFAMG